MEYEAVPIFMLVAFFFFGSVCDARDHGRFQKRMARLFLPHVFWSLVYFCWHYLINPRTSIVAGASDTKRACMDLVIQLFTGTSRNINQTMWFQVDLIILTVVIYFISRADAKRVYILSCLVLLSFIAQYFGFNYRIFAPMEAEIKFSYGRLAEMLPYAVAGIAMHGMKERLKSVDRYWLILFVGALWLIYTGGVFTEIMSLGYGGIQRVLFAIFLLAFVIDIPFQKLPRTVKIVIKDISDCTMGIYFLHNLVGAIVHKLYGFMGYPLYTLRECLIIYFACLIIILLARRIPGKCIKFFF